MTSSYSEFETVFVRPHVKEKPSTFSKISTLESVIEKVRFDRFHCIGEFGSRLNRRKKISVFKQKRIRVDRP